MRKSAHYRRAIWFNDDFDNLQDVLNFSLDEWDGDGTFSLNPETDCIIARRMDIQGRLFLSLIAFEQGAGAAVIPAIVAGGDIDSDEANAPDGMEFVQAQLLCLISQNDVLWTTHNSSIRESTVRQYLHRLISEFHDEEHAADFGLRADLDVAQLQRAFDEGIEEIDLNLGGFRSSLEEAFDFGGQDQNGLIGHILSLVTDDPTAEELEAASDIGMRVALKPGRSWKKENVKELMTEMSQNLYAQRTEFDDGFAIVTKTGLRLTHDKLTIHRPFSVEGNKRVINAFQVRDRLNDILDGLMNGGILDDDLEE